MLTTPFRLYGLLFGPGSSGWEASLPDLIITSDWGAAGELAISLGWRPQGRHFQTPRGEGRMLGAEDAFAFTTTRGDTLHLILPLPERTLLTAQYIADMGRARLVLY